MTTDAGAAIDRAFELIRLAANGYAETDEQRDACAEFGEPLMVAALTQAGRWLLDVVIEVAPEGNSPDSVIDNARALMFLRSIVSDGDPPAAQV